ncbi:MAG: hypothetical protein JO115_14180 [Pseudonocardiales bacterium]|nr:hypothetical protein [Pseudonocardiales bacterium]
MPGRHQRSTLLVRGLTWLGWQRSPDSGTVPVHDLDGLPAQRGALRPLPPVSRRAVGKLRETNQGDQDRGKDPDESNTR